MVDFNHNPSAKPDVSGEGGDAHLTPSQHNKLVGTMLNPQKRWRLNAKAKRAAIIATLTNLSDEDPRVVNGAVANLIKMEAQNQSDQHKVTDKSVPDAVQEPGATTLSIADLLAETQYLEWLRECQRHNDPRLVCTNGHAGNGKPLDDGAPRNGHRP